MSYCDRSTILIVDDVFITAPVSIMICHVLVSKKLTMLSQRGQGRDPDMKNANYLENG